MKLDALKGFISLNFHIAHKHKTIHWNNGMKIRNKVWASWQQTPDNEISETTEQPPMEPICHWQGDWHSLWQGNTHHSWA